jgi:UDP-glucose 4-epimerase
MSQQEEVELELKTFSEVLSMAERLARCRPTRFHLISSAGGLFEGQRFVTRHSSPAPRRAYGRMKLSQEEMLERSAGTLGGRVYRVASAYGFIRDRFRPGIVSRLILDGLRRVVTPITGRMTTLRDFVFVPDVAAYIADRLCEEPDGVTYGATFLAHSRPCSLLEVQHAVEEAMGHKLHVTYSMDPLNSADITFSPEVLPAGWRPSDLRVNVGIIYRDALCTAGLRHGLQPVR